MSTTTLNIACTEPRRWAEPPAPNAPDAEILAYLRHCDACAYHTHLLRASDEAFDPLLREACRDLDVPASVTGQRRRGDLSWLRRDRPALASALGERSFFERRLAQASLVAFAVLVVWVAYAMHVVTLERGAEAPLTEQTPTGWDAGALTDAQLAAAVERGRLYEVRVVSDALDGQPTRSGVLYARDSLYVVASSLPFGSRLLVTNPITGASVVVTVVDRGPSRGELTLSSAAAEVLGFEGRLLAIVEVLSRPAPPLLGP